MDSFCEYGFYGAFTLVAVLLFYIIRLKTSISAINNRKEELIKEAYFHPITQLPNKKNIKYVFDEQIDRTLRHNHSFTVLGITINNLQTVQKNSADKGGKFLIEASNIILNSTRDEDLVAHIADGQFIILFNEYLEGDKYQFVLERLKKGFAQVHEQEFSFDISMGVSKYPLDGTDSEVLIEKAIKEAVSKQF